MLEGPLILFKEALAQPGLFLVVVAAFAGGAVRGFSGFGTAMVFLPLAAQVLSPFGAVAALVVMDAFGPLPTLPRAWRDGHPRDIARLCLGAALLLPFGVYLLGQLDSQGFGLVVAVVSILAVGLLMSGLRYRGTLKPAMVTGIGGLSGLLGGVAGVAGPPVILFYMASPLPVRAIRGNITLYLFLFDLMILGLLTVKGSLTSEMVVTGLLLVPSVVLGNMAGAAIFRPSAERLYRVLAYGIILASALSALPIWG